MFFLKPTPQNWIPNSRSNFLPKKSLSTKVAHALILVSGLILGCSKSNSMKNCSKTASFVLEDNVVNASIARDYQHLSIAESLGLPNLGTTPNPDLSIQWGPNAGGILDFGIREKVTAVESAKGQRCTAFLDSDSLGDQGKWYLWTADHCLLDPLIKEVILQVYNINSGSYFRVPIRWERMQQINDLRQKMAGMPEEVQEVLLTATSRMSATQPSKALDACSTLFKKIGKFPDAQVVCSSSLDLARLEFSFKDPISPALQLTLDQIRNNQKDVHAKIKMFSKLFPDPDLAKFAGSSFSEMVDGVKKLTKDRGNLGIVKLIDSLKGCANTPALPQCTVKDQVLELPIFKDFAQVKLSDFEAALEVLEQEVSRSTLELKKLNMKSAVFLQYVSNLSFNQDKKSYDEKATLGTTGPTAYMGIPALNLIDKSKLEDLLKSQYFNVVEATPGNWVVSFPIKSDAGGVFLQPGDSGSLVSFMGLLPFGLIVSVDGKPTSGGAVLRPIPPEEESSQIRKDSNATVAEDKKEPPKKSVTRCN